MTDQPRNKGGRPPGARNKRSLEREAAMVAAQQEIAKRIPGAFDGDAHSLLMAIYKDPEQDMSLRIDAAKAAIRYEKPALSSIEADVKGKVDLRAWLFADKSPDEAK